MITKLLMSNFVVIVSCIAVIIANGDSIHKGELKENSPIFYNILNVITMISLLLFPILIIVRIWL